MEEEDLEPLVTQCPHCKTRFRVTEHQLQLAAGRVRCGACLTVFQGVEYLVWEEPSEFQSQEDAQNALDELLDELEDSRESPGDSLDSPGDPGDSSGVPADATAVADVLDPSPSAWMKGDNQLYGGHEGPSGITLEEDHWPGARVAAKAAPDRKEPGAPPPPPAETPKLNVPAPITPTPVPIAGPGVAVTAARSPALQSPAPSGPSADQEFTFGEETKRRWWVPVAIILAALTLCIQVLWYQFDRWSVDPEVRPVYELVCGVLGCELPVMRDLDAMVAKNLVVRSHPEVAGALVVNAVIVNEADFAQPFPILELKFTALQGGLVAGRQFKPEEYLAGELLGAQMVATNVPIHVELAIEDPGEAAVNYFLSFR